MPNNERENNAEGDEKIAVNKLIAITVEQVLHGRSYTVFENKRRKRLFLERLDKEYMEHLYFKYDENLRSNDHLTFPMYKIQTQNEHPEFDGQFTPYGNYPEYVLVGDIHSPQLYWFYNVYFIDTSGRAFIHENIDDFTDYVNEGMTPEAIVNDMGYVSFDDVVYYENLSPSVKDTKTIPLEDIHQRFLLRELGKIADGEYTEIPI